MHCLRPTGLWPKDRLTRTIRLNRVSLFPILNVQMVSPVPCDLHYATSFDVEHSPSNVIENDETTFWMTSGLFPQEIVLQFRKPAQILRVTTITGKVKSLVIYAAADSELNDWAEIGTKNLAAQPAKQQETHQLNYQRTSYGLKLVITKAWGPFVAVYLIRVEGPTLREQDAEQASA
jgi:heat shock protein beta-11